jgi:hypothetical protein
MKKILKKGVFRNTTILLLPLLLAVLTMFPGCDESGGITVPSGATDLGLSMKTVDNLSDNPNDAVVITSAKALISRVELEVDGKTTTQLIAFSTTAVNLPLDGSLSRVVDGYIVRDNFTKVKMQIHKAEVSETLPDAEFSEGAGDNQRYSFIIKGTYNGVPFIYKSKQSLQVIINFAATVNINLPAMNISVLFDKLKWFKSGTTVLNPNDPNNSALIDDNIKNSFKQVFKDNNSDGTPDN